MGFWTEWALQCYRAVMFPWHWLVGLEDYAVDIRYIAPQDDWGDYIYGYHTGWWCSDIPADECPDCQAYGRCPTCIPTTKTDS